MKSYFGLTTTALVGLLAAAGAAGLQQGPSPRLMNLQDSRETHLANVRKVTVKGGYAEAYWSSDGTHIICQAKRGDIKADRMYVLHTDGTGEVQVSSGDGRCTCGYFLKGDREIIYATTEGYDKAAPAPPDRSKGYVWPVWPYYALVRSRPDGSRRRVLLPKKVEAGVPTAYYAEATVSQDGKRVIFTSTMDGDIEIYSMRTSGTDIRRLTHKVGYDGGPFYSPDGKLFCWRAWYPKNDTQLAEYKDLLAQHLVKPSRMDLWVAKADGSGAHQVTDIGGASFAPSFTHDGKKLIFSSNAGDPQGRVFELFLVNIDGSGLERVTYGNEFDCFPMFSPDGTKLMWCSNRTSQSRETNIFIADWRP